MVVRGLDMFIRYFAEHGDGFVLIGGAACDLWFMEQQLAFRSTKDLDVVLIIENLKAEFVSRFWAFIRDGRYEIKARSEGGPPALYRFAKPERDDFPFIVELFCRNMPDLKIGSDQHIIPVRMEDAQSLSAILLRESYYRFLLDHCHESRGILTADAAALIPLKARAWLDLISRQANGEDVKENDIKKHRNDVFRLAVTLPGDPGAPLPGELASDVTAFLHRHPLNNPDWSAIRQAIQQTIGGDIQPKVLVSAILTYYRLGETDT